MELWSGICRLSFLMTHWRELFRVATGDPITAVVVKNCNGETGAQLAHHVLDQSRYPRSTLPMFGLA